jgi:hypothetical protein
MKRATWSAALVMLLSLAGTGSLQAQVGAIIDWINKLSGPMVLRGGPTLTVGGQAPDERLRVRTAFMYGFTFDRSGSVEPEGASIRMLSIQPMLEVTIHKYVDLGAGVSANYFFGDMGDSFWRPSFPIVASVRPSPKNDHVLLSGLRVGGGVHIFPHFAQGDFDPLTVNVKYEGTEFSLTFFAATEFYRF